jgi:serine protease Do/serine protease DegQ
LARQKGVEVVQVVEGSPAAGAGIRQEDIIVEVGEFPVEDGGDLQRLMTGDVIGRKLPVTILRGGEVLSLEVTPSEL